MPSISPHLWFDNNAAEAVRFYLSVFPDSEILSDTTFEDSGPNQDQDVQVIDFRIGDLHLTAFNGGPHQPFNDAVSFAATCRDQEELDRCWDALTADGGQAVQCGWVRDRYGLSWQVIPEGLNDLLSDPDPVRAKRAMGAVLGMIKIDLAAVKAAMDG